SAAAQDHCCLRRSSQPGLAWRWRRPAPYTLPRQRRPLRRQPLRHRKFVPACASCQCLSFVSALRIEFEQPLEALQGRQMQGNETEPAPCMPVSNGVRRHSAERLLVHGVEAVYLMLRAVRKPEVHMIWRQHFRGDERLAEGGSLLIKRVIGMA